MPQSKPIMPTDKETLDAGVNTPEELASFVQFDSTQSGEAAPLSPATSEHSGSLERLSPCDSKSTEGASFLSLSSFEEKMMAATDGSQLTSDPLIGQFINNLQVLSRLGSGGFGAVYLAEHTELQTPFAIKILNLFQSGRPEVVERFRREARAIALLNHPNIVKIADFGWLDGYGYYLVMEYLEGQSLSKIIDDWDLSQGTIPLPRIHELMRQLCGALRLVHHKGIVHRDLKPSNIVLVPGQRVPEVVKLIDFGIASLSDDESLTASGVCMGSPAYMSPEQADGLSSSLDARSDLYSLVIILYQLLTGELPFIGRGLASYVRLHLLEPPPPLHVRCPTHKWHPELEALIQQTLAKEPAERPADINEFWALCDRALEAQARLAAMAPVIETQMLPRPPPKEAAPSDRLDAETYLFSVEREVAEAPQAPTLADVGAVVMPDDLALLEAASAHPMASEVVTPAAAWAWIALLLGILIAFTSVGVWWLSRATATPNGAFSAQVTSGEPGRTSQPPHAQSPMQRAGVSNVPAEPQATWVMKRAVSRLPALYRRPPVRPILRSQPRLPARRLPLNSPTKPRPQVQPPTRRTHKKRRRLRRRKRRYRRRKRRYRRRKRPGRRRKTKARDVFGFQKDPI